MCHQTSPNDSTSLPRSGASRAQDASPDSSRSTTASPNASPASDEERARTWTRCIWEDPDDEYAKVRQLIVDVRRETIEACAKACDDEVTDWEGEDARAAAEACAVRLRKMATDSVSPEGTK